MKRLLFILSFVLMAVSASAQQRCKITATVVDAKSGAGVPGAVVEMFSTAKPDSKKYYTTGYGGKVEIASHILSDATTSVKRTVRSPMPRSG